MAVTEEPRRAAFKDLIRTSAAPEASPVDELLRELDEVMRAFNRILGRALGRAPHIDRRRRGAPMASRATDA